jgi:hypothetical protein
MDLADALGQDHPDSRGEVAIRGLLLPVEDGFTEVSYRIYKSLPDRLRPTRPEQVGTIALLQWQKKAVGQYGHGQGVPKAWRQSCIVTLIDVSEKRIIAVEEIRGPEPPPKMKAGREGSGRRPVSEVIDYLLSLPCEAEY